MFNKVLIANRGEIAVRIVRACRDLGIRAAAVYDAGDRGSLHVRLADEAHLLSGARGYADPEAILAIAERCGADAIHPGYSFLSEDIAFVQACEERGIAFVGPSSATLGMVRDKISTIEQVRAAGIATVSHSPRSYGPDEAEAIHAAAEQMGYPLVVKIFAGGRGRGTRVARKPAGLAAAIRAAQVAGQSTYGDRRIYLEQAILPSRYIEVPILGDRHGNLIHMGERDGSIQRNNQKTVEESPAPSLSVAQREQIWQSALQVARLFNLQSAATVEFVVDADGAHRFAEVKARLQVEHPVSEMVTRIDIVREQLRIAAGLPLSYSQDQVRLNGVAMLVRINAEDPWNHFLPSPGRLAIFRTPGGPNIRVDTYAYAGCEVPVRYDRLLAKLMVWGSNREECLNRLRRALDDFVIRGVQTNLPLLQRIAEDPHFADGTYTTEFSRRPLLAGPPPSDNLGDLAAIAAIAFLSRSRAARPTTPDGFMSGWHRDSRQLPR